VTAGNGKPCKRCGTSDWYKDGRCKHCTRQTATRWKKENPQRHSELNRRHERNNPEKVKTTKERWLKANQQKVREIKSRYKRNHPDQVAVDNHRRRAAKTQAGGSYTPAEWRDLCQQYGNKCLYPGCERTDLTADHVIPVSRGGSSDISNIQPLCSHHNFQKHDKIIDYRTKPGLLRWLQSKLF
jgi:hypothetical protein